MRNERPQITRHSLIVLSFSDLQLEVRMICDLFPRILLSPLLCAAPDMSKFLTAKLSVNHYQNQQVTWSTNTI